MEQQDEADGFDYLFQLLLECPDGPARRHVATFLKYVLVTLKMKEKNYLMELEEYQGEGEDGEPVTLFRPKAACARFITKALKMLTTRVAKNWTRFE